MAEDRVVVIAGAGRGLGRALAQRFLEKGYRVAGLVRGAEARRERLSRELGYADRLLLLPCDLTVPDQVNQAVGEIVRAFDRIDVLVNNVCGASRSSLLHSPDEEWTRVWEASLTGALHCTREVVNVMAPALGGRVVLITSQAGRLLNASESVYALSNAGRGAMARLLSQEVAPRGIAVTEVVLGAMHTALHAFPEERRDGDDRGYAVAAGEVADVVLAAVERGANSQVREIVLTEINEEPVVGVALSPSGRHIDGPERAIRWVPPLELLASKLAGPDYEVPDNHPERLGIAARHLEAVGPYFYLDAGSACDLHCPWCSVDKSHSTFESVANLVRIAREAAWHGLGRGMLIGGEPSLHPQLEEVVVLCREAGIRKFGMMTNGSGLGEPYRVRLLSRLGMDYWQLSWPDHRPEVLNALHGGRDRWAALHLALENLASVPENRITLYQVILRQNLAVLPQSVEFFVSLRERFPVIREVVLALAKPLGGTNVDADWFYPLREVIPPLREAIAVAQRHSLPFWVAHLPGCLTPERPQFHSMVPFSHLYSPANRHLESQSGPEMWKGDGCARCRLSPVCSGFFSSYVEQFGADLLRPTGDLLTDSAGSAVDGPALSTMAKSAVPAPDSELGKEVQEMVSQRLSGNVSVSRMTREGSLPNCGCLTLTHESGESVVLVFGDARAHARAFARKGRLALWYRGTVLPPGLSETVRPTLEALSLREGDILAFLQSDQDSST